LDELATLPDVPGSKRMPPDQAQALTRQRLYISHVEEDLASAGRLRRIEDRTGEWELQLPEGAVLGRFVQDTMEFEPSEQDREDHVTTGPFRPDWIPMSYQPRMANKSTLRPPLRGVDGLVQPYFVFPPDDRQTYYPNTFPFHCVGRVFTWDNYAPDKGPDGYGTGTLVGPRHVITAKHVCTTTPNGRMQFIPAFWDGACVYGTGAHAGGWVSNIVFLAGDTAAHDVAVLRIGGDLGNVLGWMDIFDFNTFTVQYGPNSGLYWKAGYPVDVAGGARPAAQHDITVLSAVADGNSLELRHEGDVEGGASGSPLFGFFQPPGNNTPMPFVHGVNSGGHEDRVSGEKYNTDAGGWPLQSIVAFARNFWP
jgi:V8-like Glu-specific endopeptidase